MEENRLINQGRIGAPFPVSKYPCDQKERTQRIWHTNNVLEILSANKETWTLQAADSGDFIMGFGNPFFNTGYRKELLNAFRGNEKSLRWMWDWFNGSNFEMMPMMVKINSTVRLVQNPEEIWHLFFPDGTYLMGYGDGSWNAPAFTGIKDTLKEHYSNKMLNYIHGLFQSVKAGDEVSDEQVFTGVQDDTWKRCVNKVRNYSRNLFNAICGREYIV